MNETTKTKMTEADLDHIEDALAMLDTLQMDSKPRTHANGRWVNGTMGGHRFRALVFAAHADNPDDELGDSRISKLWIRRSSDRVVVANFDRGWDIRPTTPVAEDIVDLLAAGLAEAVYDS